MEPGFHLNDFQLVVHIDLKIDFMHRHALFCA